MAAVQGLVHQIFRIYLSADTLYLYFSARCTMLILFYKNHQTIPKQSQLAAVQGGPGEPRVLIEADPENPGGGLRYHALCSEHGSREIYFSTTTK